jgi:hypothetical protein
MVVSINFKDKVKKNRKLRKTSSQASLKGISEQKQNLSERGENFKHIKESIEAMIKCFQEKISLLEKVTEKLIQETEIKGEIQCKHSTH